MRSTKLLFWKTPPTNSDCVFAALEAFGAPLRAHAVAPGHFAREGDAYRFGIAPLKIEVLLASATFDRHTQNYASDLKKLGIETSVRVVDSAQYQKRVQDYDFDMMSVRHGGSLTPGEGMQSVYGSEAAKTPGQQNMPGIMDPVVDALVEKLLVASSRAELTTICRALDRVLLAGRYWVPMWNNPDHWLAYWDIFDRPKTSPKYVPSTYNSVVLGTWWYDEEKARRIKPGG